MRAQRNTRNFNNRGEAGGKSSRMEMSCSIGCKTGNYSEVLLGVPQWTRTLSTGQECNCMSHLSLSFTQCQRRLPFKTLTICQESTLFKYTCNSTWTTSSPPPPHSFSLRETKHNKIQNHLKWLELWFSISIHPADFSRFQRTKKG